MSYLEGHGKAVQPSSAAKTCEGEAGSCTTDKQVLRLQHGASSNSPLEGTEERQHPESNVPSLVQDKAAHSCSRVPWKEPISHPLEMATATAGDYMPGCKELEASLMHAAGSKDVWLVHTALAEAISAVYCNMNTSSSTLVVRGPGSTGYRIEAVSVEQLRDVWHLKQASTNEECPSSISLKQKAHGEAIDHLGSPSPKKQRHVWTSEAHEKFSTIVDGLGDKAVPMRILDLMHMTGLTREHVASHLQKYRMSTKEHSQKEAHKQVLAQASQVLGGDGLNSMLRNLGNVGLQAMLEASGMAKDFDTVSGKDSIASARQCTVGKGTPSGFHMQLNSWTASAEPVDGGTSSMPILPPGCSSLQLPGCEDWQSLSGQGAQVEAVNRHSDQFGVSEQCGPCVQSNPADSTIPSDQDPSQGNHFDSSGDQRLDDFMDLFVLPQDL